MRLGVDHLAETLRRVTGAATGVQPEQAAKLVADIDLDRPLHDAEQALVEMSRIYLDDAVWFHEPTYAAHLNCPVVVPALLAEVFVSARQLQPRHLRPERRGHVRRAAPRRLDGAADRVRRDRRRHLHQRRHPVQPAGAAARPRPRARDPRRPGQAADPRLGRRSLQRAEGRPAARPRRRRGRHASRSTPTAGWTRPRSAGARRLRDAGLVPMAVVATAGTTDFGAIDPLRRSPACAAARRVAPRRRGVRRRAAGLAHPPAPARRDRARRLGDRRLPQDLVPAGLRQRAHRARRAPPAATSPGTPTT